MKRVIKKMIPRKLLSFYHLALAYWTAVIYCYPSKKMIAIGVTGTNGKSTTVNLIAKILEKSGARVGLTSTVNFKIGDKEWLNNTKMTMLGRFKLQKLLRDMVKAGCQYAVIETSSEGIAQYRHRGIDYDAAVFTNLTPEHVESHGGFENYKKAKGELFQHLMRTRRKEIATSPDGHRVTRNDGKVSLVPKINVINGDDPHAEYFLGFPADEKWVYSLQNAECKMQNVKCLNGKMTNSDMQGSGFVVDGIEFTLKLLGKFNVYNALAAIATARAFGIDLRICKEALEQVQGIPGRLERIEAGQNFTVVVDYAPEPASMEALYEVVDVIPHKRIIHVLGSTGGGRDIARRPILGRIAASHADYVIVTNEDPYDDDPRVIIEDVARGAEECKMKNAECKMLELFKLLDRKEAIAKALSLAQVGDLVLITGKGAEQAMVVKGGKKISWDDRAVTHELLRSS